MTLSMFAGVSAAMRHLVCEKDVSKDAVANYDVSFVFDRCREGHENFRSHPYRNIMA